MVIIGLQSEVMALTKFVHFVNPFIKNDRFRHQNIVELMGFCNSDEVSGILYKTAVYMITFMRLYIVFRNACKFLLAVDTTNMAM